MIFWLQLCIIVTWQSKITRMHTWWSLLAGDIDVYSNSSRETEFSATKFFVLAWDATQGFLQKFLKFHFLLYVVKVTWLTCI